MQTPPAWLRLFFLALLGASACAWREARTRRRAPAAGPAEFLLASELDPCKMNRRELRTLPGVGAAVADRIAVTRAAKADVPFLWEEIAGIGPRRAGALCTFLEARGQPGEPFAATRECYRVPVRPSTPRALLGLAALAAAGCSAEPEPSGTRAADEAHTPQVRQFSLGEFELSVAFTAAEGAEAVVLLHGARYSLADWIGLGTLAELERHGVRVLALDWPGSGTSPEAPREPEPAALLAELLSATGVERAVLVGPSRGGAQALAFAARADPRLVGLVLIAPGGAQTFQPGAAFRVPTLLVWGENDDIVPLSAGEALAARLPGARLVTFAGRGHACYLEDPARFHALLTAFLDELGFLRR